MRNTLDERVDNTVKRYMSKSYQKSQSPDPINHGWLDPQVMDYDAQNALDQMIQEQIDQQIMPILQSKIQGIVDMKCADFKANAKSYQEMKKETLMNQVK